MNEFFDQTLNVSFITQVTRILLVFKNIIQSIARFLAYYQYQQAVKTDQIKKTDLNESVLSKR